MGISLNASTLIVGTANGLVNAYDIASHQLLKSISSHKGLTITHLAAMLRPPDLYGHISVSLTTSNVGTKELLQTKPIAPFQRIRDPKAREAHEVLMMLPLPTEVRTADWNLELVLTLLNFRTSVILPHTARPSSSGTTPPLYNPRS